MTLIEQSAKGEGGEARMSATEEGIVWEITLPLPRSIAPEGVVSMTAELVRSASEHAREQVVPKASGKLAGTRLLVVEDEPLIALDIVAGLEEAGAGVLGPACTAAEALEIIESRKLDAALLDGNLQGHPVDDVAAALSRRNIPFLFVTGYGRENLPKIPGHVTVLSKPFGQPQLVEAAAQLLRRDNGSLPEPQ